MKRIDTDEIDICELELTLSILNESYETFIKYLPVGSWKHSEQKERGCAKFFAEELLDSINNFSKILTDFVDRNEDNI